MVQAPQLAVAQPELHTAEAGPDELPSRHVLDAAHQPQFGAPMHEPQEVCSAQ